MHYSSATFLFLVIVLVVILSTCKPKDFHYQFDKSLVAEKAMIVTAHPLASKIGTDILQKGGNAIDASIAVQFALAVCYPQAGNIGGGGFMVYRDAKGEVRTLDYREKAPLLATEDMYLDADGNVTDKSIKGHLAAGVPGSVAGMFEAFQKFSKLKDWKALVQPAIQLAEKGFIITQQEADNLNEEKAEFISVNKFKPVFCKDIWKEGDRLTQKELAHTLKAIKDKGADGFYKGEVANLIVSDMKKNNGIITLKDLEVYKPVWRPSISFDYRGYTIYSMGPPSSGGIVLNQIMKSVEPYNLKSMGFHSPECVHLMVEAERRAYADRATHLGDSDFYAVPQNELTDSAYIAERMKNFDPHKATDSKSISAGSFAKESDQTTHFCIVDQFGDAVSVTTTLNASYGSHAIVEGAGFILNNEMDDFSAKPGTPNMYGLIGAEANKIEPGKRMLSAMTPTIVVKDGILKIVVGTPGGSTIITSVFQTLVNIIDFGMSASEAVAAPRFHHQWQPDVIQIEEDCLQAETKKVLEAMGHTIKIRDKIGRVEAIIIKAPHQIQGGADVRGDDDAEGF